MYNRKTERDISYVVRRTYLLLQLLPPILLYLYIYIYCIFAIYVLYIFLSVFPFPLLFPTYMYSLTFLPSQGYPYPVKSPYLLYLTSSNSPPLFLSSTSPLLLLYFSSSTSPPLLLLFYSSSIPHLSFSLYSSIRKPITRSKFNLNSSNSQRHYKIGHNPKVFLHSFRYETTS